MGKEYKGGGEHKVYRVKWEIDVISDSPRNAARQAKEAQTCNESWANVFTVIPPDDDEVRIDLEGK